MAAISCRPADRGDEGFLRALYAARRTDLAGLAVEHLATQFDARRAGYRAAHPGAGWFIVLDAGRAVGEIVVDRDRDGGHRVVDLCVMPEARGRGVGTAVLRGVLERAAVEGVAVELTVDRHNRAAQRLYRRLGFQVTDADQLVLHMTWRPFAGFRAVALADDDLLAELLACDPEALADLVVARAATLDITLTTADVHAAIAAERRAWFERWP